MKKYGSSTHTPQVLVAQCLEHPNGDMEIVGLIPTWNSEILSAALFPVTLGVINRFNIFHLVSRGKIL